MVGGAGVATPFDDEGTLQPPGGGTGATRRGTVAANAWTTTTTSWGQALRSEWASPSETIIDAVTTSSTPVGATAVAAVVAAPVDEEEGGKGEEGEERTCLEGQIGARSRWRRAAGAEAEGGGPSLPKRVSFASQPNSVAAAEALDKVEISNGRGEAEKQERGCTVPGTRAETNAVAGGGGGGGGLGKTKAVRWGRMDLLSVLYPPPAAGEGV